MGVESVCSCAPPARKIRTRLRLARIRLTTGFRRDVDRRRRGDDFEFFIAPNIGPTRAFVYGCRRSGNEVRSTVCSRRARRRGVLLDRSRSLPLPVCFPPIYAGQQWRALFITFAPCPDSCVVTRRLRFLISFFHPKKPISHLNISWSPSPCDVHATQRLSQTPVALFSNGPDALESRKTMDVAETQTGVNRVRDQLKIRSQKLFQDFLEEWVVGRRPVSFTDPHDRTCFYFFFLFRLLDSSKTAVPNPNTWKWPWRWRTPSGSRWRWAFSTWRNSTRTSRSPFSKSITGETRSSVVSA